ncbi:MAG: hypothetical protein ABSF28_03410 [Terracidiphilus sp.]|jgi:hypothetical protein
MQRVEIGWHLRWADGTCGAASRSREARTGVVLPAFATEKKSQKRGTGIHRDDPTHRAVRLRDEWGTVVLAPTLEKAEKNGARCFFAAIANHFMD